MLSMHVQLSEEALFQEVGGEAVILDLATSTYFGLNLVGARCWQLLQESPDMASVCRQLLLEFEVDAAQLELDLAELLNQLSAAGLVKVVQG